MSEKKKKVFISGPMTGIKDFNKPAFDRVEQWLTQAGYSVFNPARMHFDDTWTHEQIMRIDLAALSQCDYICMLGGWESSIGAMQEYRYAMATGIEMFHSCYIERYKEEPKISCDTCKYSRCMTYEEPCKSCCVYHTNWEPKPTSDTPKPAPLKTCKACKYSRYTMNEEPCKSCPPVHTNWEPKEEE